MKKSDEYIQFRNKLLAASTRNQLISEILSDIQLLRQDINKALDQFTVSVNLEKATNEGV